MMKYSLAVMVVCLAGFQSMNYFKAHNIQKLIKESKVPSYQGGPETGTLTTMSILSNQVSAKRKGNYFDLFSGKRTTLFADNAHSVRKASFSGASHNANA